MAVANASEVPGKAKAKGEYGDAERGEDGAKSLEPTNRYFRPFSDSLYMYLMEGL